MAKPVREVTRLSEKPTCHRYFVATLSLLVCTRAGAQAALTETEAVSRSLQRAPFLQTLEGQVMIEEGRGCAASSYPNPELGYQREQTFGSLGDAEDIVSIKQTIDLANRRGLQADAGRARARAAQLEGEGARLAVAIETRARFYDVLYRQERVRAVESWIARIDEALAIVTRRERSGDVSVYDLRRLERERAVAVGRIETDRAALEGARARLRAFVGDGASPILAMGTLLPAADPPELAKLRVSSHSRAELRALEQRIEAADHERRAASRGWVPDLTLQGGWKRVDYGDQGRADGFIAGASLTLPIWDRSSGAARIAEGEMRLVRGQRALLRAELDTTLDGARAETVALRHAAAAFRQNSIAASTELVRIASAGYQGGELGLLELLDAYRGAADDELTSLEMEQGARRARLELDQISGAALP